MRARTALRSDGIAIALVGVMSLARVVVAFIPDMSPVDVELRLLPMVVWSGVWSATALACFAALRVFRLRPLAIGFASFSLTAWGMNWGLILATTYPALNPETNYLLLSSMIGNWSIVALLLWGLARGKAGDPPDAEDVRDVLKEVESGGSRH